MLLVSHVSVHFAGLWFAYPVVPSVIISEGAGKTLEFFKKFLKKIFGHCLRLIWALL